MLARDEDILKTAEEWRKSGRDVAVATVVAGLVGVWLFGRIEGGVLDPIAYLDEVQGWPLVGLQLLAGAGLAAASSR